MSLWTFHGCMLLLCCVICSQQRFNLVPLELLFAQNISLAHFFMFSSGGAADRVIIQLLTEMDG